MSITYKDTTGKQYKVDDFQVNGETKKTILVKAKGGKLWKCLLNNDAPIKEDEEEVCLLKYAQENNLTPVGLPEVLQNTSFESSDYIKLNNDELLSKVNEYFELLDSIKSLDSEREQKIKETKEEYKTLVVYKKDLLDIVMPIAKTGMVEERVDCSWERIPEEGKMILVRRDTLKPLSLRDMNAEERLNNDLFDGCAEEEVGGNQEDDTDGVDQNYSVDGEMENSNF